MTAVRGRGVGHLRRAALAVATIAASACLATRRDVEVLQLDLANGRRDAARADSLRSASLDARLAALDASMRALADTVAGAGQRAARFEGDAREQLRAVREQLIQVQELTGQSQRRLQDLRASLDARPAEPAARGGAAGDSTPAARGPGPNELYKLATDQLRRGSYGAARVGLNDLLRRYPESDLAPDAQYALAAAYEGERNVAAADSAYALVVARYPSSDRAPTALYKRARARQDAGHRAEARALYQELLRRYPRADEATLAREAVRELAGAGASGKSRS